MGGSSSQPNWVKALGNTLIGAALTIAGVMALSWRDVAVIRADLSSFQTSVNTRLDGIQNDVDHLTNRVDGVVARAKVEQ